MCMSATAAPDSSGAALLDARNELIGRTVGNQSLGRAVALLSARARTAERQGEEGVEEDGVEEQEVEQLAS